MLAGEIDLGPEVLEQTRIGAVLRGGGGVGPCLVERAVHDGAPRGLDLVPDPIEPFALAGRPLLDRGELRAEPIELARHQRMRWSEGRQPVDRAGQVAVCDQLPRLDDHMPARLVVRLDAPLLVEGRLRPPANLSRFLEARHVGFGLRAGPDRGRPFLSAEARTGTLQRLRRRLLVAGSSDLLADLAELGVIGLGFPRSRHERIGLVELAT